MSIARVREEHPHRIPSGHGAPLPDPHLRVPDERARFRTHRRHAHGRRHAPTEDVDQARVIVLNTCAIRENADNKLYGNLGHLKPVKDRNPGLKIVVSGCLAQKDQDLIQRKAPWVDVVVGTHAMPQLLQLLEQAETDGPQMDVREYTETFPERVAGSAPRSRSVRGSRSRPGATTRAPSASCRSSEGRSAPARSATSLPRCRGWPRAAWWRSPCSART